MNRVRNELPAYNNYLDRYTFKKLLSLMTACLNYHHCILEIVYSTKHNLLLLLPLPLQPLLLLDYASIAGIF